LSQLTEHSTAIAVNPQKHCASQHDQARPAYVQLPKFLQEKGI
jgi:hypothetical protein